MTFEKDKSEPLFLLFPYSFLHHKFFLNGILREGRRGRKKWSWKEHLRGDKCSLHFDLERGMGPKKLLSMEERPYSPIPILYYPGFWSFFSLVLGLYFCLIKHFQHVLAYQTIYGTLRNSRYCVLVTTWYAYTFCVQFLYAGTIYQNHGPLFYRIWTIRTFDGTTGRIRTKLIVDIWICIFLPVVG